MHVSASVIGLVGVSLAARPPDPEALTAFKARGGRLVDSAGVMLLATDELLALDCELLIPAA